MSPKTADTRSGVSYRTLAIAILVVLLLSVAVCAAIVLPIFQNRAVTSSKPVKSVVRTECGKVQGKIDNGVHVFKGIPYAEPPVGRLRWKPPVPKSPVRSNCWTGTYQASNFDSMCIQKLDKTSGSEDCLYLNVWTPSLDKSALLPVMVWIYGGSLEIGSGNFPDYSPNPTLAADTNAVYVSFNYRLNVFGFLALNLLSSQSRTNTSGNYGFMDQQLVLKWVQSNIRNFGGNPSLVTVFGQSSGGTSILALLASPLSQDLFHRAWLMSSSVLLNKTLSEVSQDNRRFGFLDNTGCNSLDCLYNLSPEQLVSAIPWNEWPRWSMDDAMNIPTKGLFNGALAIIDGYVLPEEPLTVFRAGRGMNVPVMIGTLSQETSMAEVMPGIRTWTWDNYTSYIRNKLKPFGDNIADRALELYPVLQNAAPEYQLTSLSTDIRVTCPNTVLTNALASSSKLRVYRYIVTSHPVNPIHVFGLPFAAAYAFHAWDSIVFFGGLKTYFTEPSKDNLDFKRILDQEMLHFARNGFPYTLNWTSYPNSSVVLSSKLDITEGYHMEECQFWLRNGFFSYGWVN